MHMCTIKVGTNKMSHAETIDEVTQMNVIYRQRITNLEPANISKDS